MGSVLKVWVIFKHSIKVCVNCFKLCPQIYAPWRNNGKCPCMSAVPDATHEASRGPEKGAVSAQKALRGSETETRELLGGTEENSVSPMRGLDFLEKGNRKKLS